MKKENKKYPNYGFDEAEIALEIHTQLSASTADQASPEVDADEFESCYLWFIS
jgi:hypothetical protein